MAEYRRTVREAIKREPAAVEINRDSIQALAAASSPLMAIAQRVPKIVIPLYPAAAEDYAMCLRAAGFKSIEEVVNSLERDSDLILRFEAEWTKQRKIAPGRHIAGVPLVYLSLIRIARDGSAEQMREFVRVIGFAPDDVEAFAERATDTYRQVVAE